MLTFLPTFDENLAVVLFYSERITQMELSTNSLTSKPILPFVVRGNNDNLFRSGHEDNNSDAVTV